MKQKDIALIIVIVALSACLSVLLMSVLFGGKHDKKTQVIVVEKISADFPDVDTRYFNKDSIDYTQLIQIGTKENPTPFGTGVKH